MARLHLVGLLTVNAVKDYYDFMRYRAKFRKVSVLLFVSIITMEILIIITQGHGNCIAIQTNSITPTLIPQESCSWAVSLPSSSSSWSRSVFQTSSAS